ncbi:MAG: GPP34 family phosphoprotein, partial [Gammaproteobacteria bacterium]|nr:GPP34 family phosphoprotein [Gammaproteobacteria bacterium]
MLTISEEILLLMLDDETGWLSVVLPGHRIRAAISGAVLMDLALA